MTNSAVVQCVQGLFEESCTGLLASLSDLAIKISTYRARKLGYNIRNPRETAVRPIDLPNQAFLPK